MNISIICLTQNGLNTANKIQSNIGGTVFGLNGRVETENTFENATDFIGKQFASGNAVIGVCATAILVRSIAPFLNAKKTDSPAIAISENGDTVVPVLGGHYGGYDLAFEIGEVLNTTPAITNAGDKTLGFSFDNLPSDWELSDNNLVKKITAQLLQDGGVNLIDDIGVDFPNKDLFKGGDLTVHITNQSGFENENTLVIYPPSIVLGVGLERNAPASGLIEFVDGVLDDNNYSHKAISVISSVDLKIDEGGLKGLSKHYNKPLSFFNTDELNKHKDNIPNPSDVVFNEIGCYGVAEPCVLANGGEIVVEKQKSDKHTVAIGKLNTPAVIKNGKPSGKLFVVGIGAGEDQWRTPQATRAIKESEVIVGYKLYLDLINDLITGKETADSELGEEEARVRKAIEIASTGKNVSLVCSGDASIYALATLVFELLDRNPDNRNWQGIDIELVPGISAFQACSARLGAPFNHDFCLVSLSDLLTPREAILKRLEKLGEGDFVVAFYNPQSKRRKTLLKEAQKTLLNHRPENTPVAIGRNLGRDGENITITTLKDFEPEMVDMLSLVVIGNSETKTFTSAGREFVYTPRGYAKKMED
ncbi:MAG: precorrin-3B C(17)-methyltransferase [Alphaproteobacteria bacterium]